MLTLDRKEDDSIFLGLSPEADRTMTLGELFESGVIEIKVTKIKESRVELCIDAPKPISVILAELSGKLHGTDFPSHTTIQKGA